MPGVAIFPADPGRGTCPRARGEAGAATTRGRRQPGRPLADPPARALQSGRPESSLPPATAVSPYPGWATARLASRKQRPPGPETRPPPGLRREAGTGRAAAAGGGAADSGAAERRYQGARLRARRARGVLTTSFPRSQAPPRSSPPRSPPPRSSSVRSQAPPLSSPPRSPPTCSSDPQPSSPGSASLQPLCCPQTCRPAHLNPPAASTQTRTPHPFSPQLYSPPTPQYAALHHRGLKITVTQSPTVLQPGVPKHHLPPPSPFHHAAPSCHLLNLHPTQSCSLQYVPAARSLWLLPSA